MSASEVFLRSRYINFLIIIIIITSKSAFVEGVGHFEAKYYVEGLRLYTVR